MSIHWKYENVPQRQLLKDWHTVWRQLIVITNVENVLTVKLSALFSLSQQMTSVTEIKTGSLSLLIS